MKLAPKAFGVNYGQCKILGTYNPDEITEQYSTNKSIAYENNCARKCILIAEDEEVKLINKYLNSEILENRGVLYSVRLLNFSPVE